MKTAVIQFYIFCTVVVIFCGCRKQSPEPINTTPVIVNTELISGLPAGYKRINGYFYANAQVRATGPGYIAADLSGDAAICDPAKDIISTYDHYTNSQTSFINPGNISIGEVYFKTIRLSTGSFSPTIFYRFDQLHDDPDFDYKASWSGGGNGPFQEFDLELPGGFPVILQPTLSLTASLSKDFVINIDEMIDDYDSVVVTINNLDGNQARQRIAKADSTVTFKSNQINPVFLNSTNNCNISYYAFKYFHITRENKIYVFELSTKFTRGIRSVP